ncbi:hypothetical protein BJX66DRAFT_301363 [Aspergillus keveii]|uniref:Uncharacterized protein n=1 Tax=Aspergillus keveii TaxID=714993 RepID=A0ABR4G9T7_9EURO
MPPYHTWNHEYFAVYRVGYGGTKPGQAEEILAISEAKSPKEYGSARTQLLAYIAMGVRLLKQVHKLTQCYGLRVQEEIFRLLQYQLWKVASVRANLRLSQSTAQRSQA